MPELKRRISSESADLLRVIGRIPDDGDLTWALEAMTWLPRSFFRPPSGDPIGRVTRIDSRATCRECGETITAGQEAVVFGYEATPQARVVAAYVHSNVAECGP